MKPIADISFWQPPSSIDYDKFAESVSGVILRGAYGLSKDTAFEKHYEEFSKRNVPLGAYHYTIGNYSGREQAKAFSGFIKGKVLKLGEWHDVEDRRAITGLTSNVVIEYQNELEQLISRLVGIYTGVYAWYEIMGAKSKEFFDRLLWLAHYGVITPSLPRQGGWSKWTLWQHTDNLAVEGYYSGVDGNKFYGTEQEFINLFKLNAVLEPPIVSGTFLCVYCNQYTENDSRGNCGKCGAPRDNLIPPPSFPTLRTTRIVNARLSPNTSSSVVGVRQTGEYVVVSDIFVASVLSVWVKDNLGWSALVHNGVKYME